MIRDQFFTDPDGGFTAYSDKVAFQWAWKKVENFEAESGKSLNEPLNKEDYISLFNSMGLRHANIFFNARSIIMYYVRYLIAHDALPPEQENILSSVSLPDLDLRESPRIVYFKNLTMLQEAIEDSVKTGAREDEALYDVPSAILYLAWFGFTKEQIINVKKTDVTDEGVLLDGKLVEMPYLPVMQLLTGLRDSEGYRQQAKGVIFRKYVYSDYLIRTENNPQIDDINFRGIVYRLNKVMDRTYSLEYKMVYESGVFHRAYMLECNSTDFDLNDMDFASKVFCMKFDNRQKLKAKIQDYQMYKRLFY